MTAFLPFTQESHLKRKIPPCNYTLSLSMWNLWMIPSEPAELIWERIFNNKILLWSKTYLEAALTISGQIDIFVHTKTLQ